MHVKYQKCERSVVLSMCGGTWRMVRWKLFRPRIHCGISFTSAIFTSTKMQSLRRHFAIASAFRIHNFLELVEDICSNDLFDQWCGYKSNNKKVSPVELLLLGLLCYLGRGWTVDDCEESTAIDKDVRSTVLYKKWC